MKTKLCIFLSSVATLVTAQRYSNSEYTTPVPILKQIDKHNEDGSYSYGYEAADGTFKIETKYPTGEVYGKYGYIDDQGQLREVEYGASRRGFEPAGNEIQVPPPTLKDTTRLQYKDEYRDDYRDQYRDDDRRPLVPPPTLKSNINAVSRPLGPNEEDDGQYREDPAAYYKNDPNLPKYASPPPSRYTHSFHGFNDYAPSYPSYHQSDYRPSYTPPPPAPYVPPSSHNYAPYSPAPSYYSPPAPPAYPGWNQFQGHPAQNVDIFSGSYTVQYR